MFICGIDPEKNPRARHRRPGQNRTAKILTERFASRVETVDPYLGLGHTGPSIHMYRYIYIHIYIYICIWCVYIYREGLPKLGISKLGVMTALRLILFGVPLFKEAT